MRGRRTEREVKGREGKGGEGRKGERRVKTDKRRRIELPPVRIKILSIPF